MTVYPVSKIQDQFRLINKMHPESPAYNQASVFEINGPLDLDILKQSLDIITVRHQSLRTTFDETPDGPVQVIHDSSDINFSVIDLRNAGVINREKIDKMLQDEISSPFDLYHGPLLRIKIFLHERDKFYLCITMHHIITDLHSKQFFAKEISSVYNSLIISGMIELDDQLWQYHYYSENEKKHRTSPEFKAMLSYWKEKLSDAETFLDIPVDHPRPDIPLLCGNAKEILISQSLTEKIRIFSDAKAVNIFVTLLSAYYVLLHKYTSHDSIIVGLPLTNRRSDIYKQIIGCFINIVPLKIDDVGSRSFCDLLTSVRKAMLEAHRNQEVPFGDIVNQIKLERIPGINPVYQTGFAFEPPMELDLTGVECIPVNVHCGGSQLELFLTLWEKNNTVTGRIEYNTALFEEITITSLIENYLSLINELLDNPEEPLSSISFKHQGACSVFILKGDEVMLPGDSVSVNQMIEQQVLRTPGRIAAVYNDTEITYSELNNRANQLAHYLIDLGVGRESIVGVYLDRSIEMLIGLLAIHKAGGAYLPLDPEFPQMRICYMIEHSGVSLILTQDSLMESIPESKAVIVSLDSGLQWLSQKSKQNPGIIINGEELAYVMYTSGSTGKPKGVQVKHSSVVNFLISMSKKPGMKQDDVLLAVTTISFDISVLELFLPLTCGACTVILPKTTVMDGILLIHAIDRYKPTVMQATPTTWRILTASGWSGAKQLKVLCGGEAMPRDIARRLSGIISSLWNMYGPTETTVWSTCFEVTSPEDSIYLGTPIDNTDIYILDSAMNPLPRGVPGEIYIGGSGVAKGYINDPDRTNDRFIYCTFPESGALLYKTGDTGRITYNGSLEFFSRIDSQVKVRGYRIELPEIEFHLNQFPDIIDSASAVIKDSSGNGRIVGYYVPVPGVDIVRGDLRKFLQDRIPGYMIPDIFMQMKKIPLTPNGKIDRKELPMPVLGYTDKEREIVLPVSNVEKKLLLIWQEILSVERISIYDNYFDLGGNSFMAVEIVNRINREFGTTVTILMMFKYTTISSMAGYISSPGISGESDEKFIQNIKSRTGKQREAYSKQKAARGV